MNATVSRITFAAGLVLALATTGCSSMSRNTLTGAGIGGVTGAIVTNGSPAGAAVGAVVGGAIGNEMDRHRR